jgi:hypothetical protein
MAAGEDKCWTQIAINDSARQIDTDEPIVLVRHGYHVPALMVMAMDIDRDHCRPSGLVASIYSVSVPSASAGCPSRIHILGSQVMNRGSWRFGLGDEVSPPPVRERQVSLRSPAQPFE